jgi:hypothetical protein
MKMRTAIALTKASDYFHVGVELIREFAEFGLYPTVQEEGEVGIEGRDLARLEKILSLHRALGINKEGLDVILELREMIAGLQDEPEGLRIRGLLIEVDG